MSLPAGSFEFASEIVHRLPMPIQPTIGHAPELKATPQFRMEIQLGGFLFLEGLHRCREVFNGRFRSGYEKDSKTPRCIWVVEEAGSRDRALLGNLALP